MQRQFGMTVAGQTVNIPTFFPSISSVKSNLAPLDYLRLLTALSYPSFLISAYDIHSANSSEQEEIAHLISKCRAGASVVLLDSGNYESYWKGDRLWGRSDFHSILRRYPTPLALSFDNQAPPQNIDRIVDEIEEGIVQDQARSSGSIVPIIHAARDILPTAVYRVAFRLRPLAIAVPERLLGDGILNRAKTVLKIRTSLSQLDYYCPLHLLGTGNPLSIAIFTLAGADTFDGLEWCQTAVDYESGRLHHFQHWDFFSDQTALANQSDIPYVQKVLAHNLIFYKKWVTKIREMLLSGGESCVAENLLPEGWRTSVLRQLSGSL